MAYRVKDYQSFYREAKVCKDKAEFIKHSDYEKIYVSDSQAIFKSDGHIIRFEDNTVPFFKSLVNGDIINIDERGILNTIFHIREDNATIYITGNCNSNCMMCPMSDVERREDYSIRSKFVIQYINMLPDDLHFYCITGGEPTINLSLFLKALSFLKDKFPNAEGQILTNGRSFSSEELIEKVLEVCPHHLLVAIPLHGSNAEIHDAISRAPGSFDQTLQGIKNLIMSHIDVEIRIVVNKLNYSDIFHTAKLIIQEIPDVKVVNFISLELRGNCQKNKEEIYLDARESFKHSENAIQILIENGINVGLYNYPLCCVEKKYWLLCKKSITPSKVMFSPVCKSCSAMDECGGLFDTTFRGGSPELIPIKDGYVKSF